MLPVAVLIVQDACIVEANPAAIQLLEATDRLQLIGLKLNDFVHPLDQSRSQVRLIKATGQWVNPPAKFRIRTSKNNFRMLLVSSKSITYQDKDAILMSALDMTEHSTMEERLRQSETDFRRLFENMQDVYYRTDVHGVLLKISPAVKRMLGYEISDVEGRSAKSFYLEATDTQNFKEAILKAGMVTDFPGKLRHKDGSVIDISFNSQALFDDEGYFSGVEGIFRDVTHRNLMEKELKRLATTDPLTGIDNRRAFLDHAEHIFKSCQRYQYPMTLMMLDLDFFKKINDQFGHLAGDQVLIGFTAAVKCEMRDIDLFGRLGGEEFCILLQQTNKQEAFQVAERIRLRVQNLQHSGPDAEQFSITVSIGIANNEFIDESLGKLLERADDALYYAKTHGRNQVQ